MAYAGLEVKAGMREGRERSARLLRFHGLEHLDAALTEGRGALLYTLHLCGIYTLFAALAARGYEVNLIRRAPPASLSPWQLARAQRRDAAVERALGCRFLWMEPDNFGVAVQATNALRRNEVVVALIDHLHSGPGVEVEMLGAPTVLAGGYGRLAEAAGAPLLDVFLHRGARSHPLVAEVGAPLRPAKTLSATVQECASRLGAHLERHPEVWIASPDGL
jgi:lauroyl/myristoyl acyltransferase